MLTFLLELVGICFLLGCWALRLKSNVFGESFTDMWMESLCICVLLFEHLRHLRNVESCRHCAGVLLMCWLLEYQYPSFFVEPIPSENTFHLFLLHVIGEALMRGRLHGVLLVMAWVLPYVCTLMGLHRLNVLQHVAVAFVVMTSEPWKEDTAVLFLQFDLGGVHTMQIYVFASARSWILPMTVAVFYCAGKAGLWIYCAGLWMLVNIGLNAMKWLCNAGQWLLTLSIRIYRAGKAAVERAAAERAERADVQRKAAEKEAAKMAAADKAAAKKAAAEKAAAEKTAAEKTATVKAAVAIKAVADKASAVKAAAEKAAAEKAAAVKAAAAVRATAEKAAAVIRRRPRRLQLLGRRPRRRQLLGRRPRRRQLLRRRPRLRQPKRRELLRWRLRKRQPRRWWSGWRSGRPWSG